MTVFDSLWQIEYIFLLNPKALYEDLERLWPETDFDTIEAQSFREGFLAAARHAKRDITTFSRMEIPDE